MLVYLFKQKKYFLSMDILSYIGHLLPGTLLCFQGIVTIQCYHMCESPCMWAESILRDQGNLTHMRKWQAFYKRLKFLWRNEWLCPWSAHWTLFNINVLLKSASFASRAALWAALEPMGRLRSPEWSGWLLFITHDCGLPRIKTLSTTWQGRGLSIYSLALKL